MLGEELGWHNLYYVRQNTAPSGQRLQVTDDDRAMIAERNALDVALYRHVAERFEERIAADPEFEAKLARFRRGNAIYRPWGRLAYRAKQSAVRAAR